MLRRILRKIMHPRAPLVIPFAPAPFDNPQGDLILRSHDDVDFRVFQAILGVSSEFFSTMFEAGQAPNEEMRDGCPVVRVSEEKEALDGLLRIIYPTEAPVLNDLRIVRPILAAALKYDMEKPIQVAREALHTFVSKEPLRVWAIAVQYRLEGDARVAAEEMVRQRLSVQDSTPPEICEIHAGAYYRLLQFKRLRGAVEKSFKFCDPPPSRHTVSSLSLHQSSDPQFISPEHHSILSFVDVKCCSSDGRYFKAHKAFLAFVSPILGDMMTSIPSPSVASGVKSDDLPVVPFAEDGATLRVILGLCYPITEGKNLVSVFPITRKVVDAVAKYQMKTVATMLQRHWEELYKSDPLQAYLLAVREELKAETVHAAQQLANWRSEWKNDFDNYYVAVMETTPAHMYRDALASQSRGLQQGGLVGVQTGFSRCALTSMLHGAFWQLTFYVLVNRGFRGTGNVGIMPDTGQTMYSISLSISCLPNLSKSLY